MDFEEKYDELRKSILNQLGLQKSTSFRTSKTEGVSDFVSNEPKLSTEEQCNKPSFNSKDELSLILNRKQYSQYGDEPCWTSYTKEFCSTKKDPITIEEFSHWQFMPHRSLSRDDNPFNSKELQNPMNINTLNEKSKESSLSTLPKDIKSTFNLNNEYPLQSPTKPTSIFIKEHFFPSNHIPVIANTIDCKSRKSLFENNTNPIPLIPRTPLTPGNYSFIRSPNQVLNQSSNRKNESSKYVHDQAFVDSIIQECHAKKSQDLIFSQSKIATNKVLASPNYSDKTFSDSLANRLEGYDLKFSKDTTHSNKNAENVINSHKCFENVPKFSREEVIMSNLKRPEHNLLMKLIPSREEMTSYKSSMEKFSPDYGTDSIKLHSSSQELSLGHLKKKALFSEATTIDIGQLTHNLKITKSGYVQNLAPPDKKQAIDSNPNKLLQNNEMNHLEVEMPDVQSVSTVVESSNEQSSQMQTFSPEKSSSTINGNYPILMEQNNPPNLKDYSTALKPKTFEASVTVEISRLKNSKLANKLVVSTDDPDVTQIIDEDTATIIKRIKRSVETRESLYTDQPNSGESFVAPYCPQDTLSTKTVIEETNHLLEKIKSTLSANGKEYKENTLGSGNPEILVSSKAYFENLSKINAEFGGPVKMTGHFETKIKSAKESTKKSPAADSETVSEKTDTDKRYFHSPYPKLREVENLETKESTLSSLLSSKENFQMQHTESLLPADLKQSTDELINSLSNQSQFVQEMIEFFEEKESINEMAVFSNQDLCEEKLLFESKTKRTDINKDEQFRKVSGGKLDQIKSKNKMQSDLELQDEEFDSKPAIINQFDKSGVIFESSDPFPKLNRPKQYESQFSTQSAKKSGRISRFGYTKSEMKTSNLQSTQPVIQETMDVINGQLLTLQTQLHFECLPSCDWQLITSLKSEGPRAQYAKDLIKDFSISETQHLGLHESSVFPSQTESELKLTPSCFSKQKKSLTPDTSLPITPVLFDQNSMKIKSKEVISSDPETFLEDIDQEKSDFYSTEKVGETVESKSSSKKSTVLDKGQENCTSQLVEEIKLVPFSLSKETINQVTFPAVSESSKFVALIPIESSSKLSKSGLKLCPESSPKVPVPSQQISDASQKHSELDPKLLKSSHTKPKPSQKISYEPTPIPSSGQIPNISPEPSLKLPTVPSPKSSKSPKAAEHSLKPSLKQSPKTSPKHGLGTSQSSPKHSPETSPNISGSSPKTSSQSSPKQSSEPSPKSSPEPSPKSSPEPSPKSSSQPSPKRSPESSPKRSPESSPKRSPESSPKRSPESSPKRSPESSPKRSPESSPKRSPESSPKVSPQPSPKLSPQPSPKPSELSLKTSVEPSPKPSPLPSPKSSGTSPKSYSEHSPKISEPKTQSGKISPIPTPKVSLEQTAKVSPDISPKLSPKQSPKISPESNLEPTLKSYEQSLKTSAKHTQTSQTFIGLEPLLQYPKFQGKELIDLKAKKFPTKDLECEDWTKSEFRKKEKKINKSHKPIDKFSTNKYSRTNCELHTADNTNMLHFSYDHQSGLSSYPSHSESLFENNLSTDTEKIKSSRKYEVRETLMEDDAQKRRQRKSRLKDHGPYSEMIKRIDETDPDISKYDTVVKKIPNTLSDDEIFHMTKMRSYELSPREEKTSHLDYYRHEVFNPYTDINDQGTALSDYEEIQRKPDRRQLEEDNNETYWKHSFSSIKYENPCSKSPSKEDSEVKDLNVEDHQKMSIKKIDRKQLKKNPHLKEESYSGDFQSPVEELAMGDRITIQSGDFSEGSSTRERSSLQEPRSVLQFSTNIHELNYIRNTRSQEQDHPSSSESAPQTTFKNPDVLLKNWSDQCSKKPHDNKMQRKSLPINLKTLWDELQEVNRSFEDNRNYLIHLLRTYVLRHSEGNRMRDIEETTNEFDEDARDLLDELHRQYQLEKKQGLYTMDTIENQTVQGLSTHISRVVSVPETLQFSDISIESIADRIVLSSDTFTSDWFSDADQPGLQSIDQSKSRHSARQQRVLKKRLEKDMRKLKKMEKQLKFHQLKNIDEESRAPNLLSTDEDDDSSATNIFTDEKNEKLLFSKSMQTQTTDLEVKNGKKSSSKKFKQSCMQPEDQLSSYNFQYDTSSDSSSITEITESCDTNIDSQDARSNKYEFSWGNQQSEFKREEGERAYTKLKYDESKYSERDRLPKKSHRRSHQSDESEKLGLHAYVPSNRQYTIQKSQINIKNPKRDDLKVGGSKNDVKRPTKKNVAWFCPISRQQNRDDSHNRNRPSPYRTRLSFTQHELENENREHSPERSRQRSFTRASDHVNAGKTEPDMSLQEAFLQCKQKFIEESRRRLQKLTDSSNKRQKRKEAKVKKKSPSVSQTNICYKYCPRCGNLRKEVVELSSHECYQKKSSQKLHRAKRTRS